MDSKVRAFSLAPVTLHCFGTGFKMASRLATVSKDKILAVNEAAVPTNTKKETKFGLSVFTGGWKKIFLTELAKNHKK